MKAAVFVMLIPTLLIGARQGAVHYPAGTATLSGSVVVDEPNGPPLRRATVTVVTMSDARLRYQTSTDDRGRFSIGGLPAANVKLFVTKPTYVMTYYGARQPGSTLGVPIALVDRQTTTVTMRVPRGSVIAGAVTDENGQPMTGVGVTVQQVGPGPLGQRVFTPVTGNLLQASTDDRGHYRLYGLAPGDYVVLAQPRLLTNGEVQQTTAADLQWAERQIRGGPPGGAGASDAQPPARNQPMTYAPVYFPTALNRTSAGVLTLAAGQERSGVDLRMQFVPTAHIEGVVTGVDGQPARGVQLMLFSDNDTGPNGVGADAERLAMMLEVGLVAGSGTASTLPDGSFSIVGVVPGNYTMVARTGGPPGRGADAGTATQATWATEDLRVDGQDIRGLSLRLAPGQKLGGRVVFEGTMQPTAPVRASIAVRAVTQRGITVSAQQSLNGGGTDTFTIGGLVPAPYRVSASAPGWLLKSAVLGDRDVADTAFDVTPGEDVNGLVLTFTNTPAEVSGVLYDSAGKPMSDLLIVLFSQDRASWFSGSRRVLPAVRPASDGKFAFSSLVSGPYYLAALTDATPADLGNPQFLAQVIPAAIKITVANGEKKVQDLRVAGR